MHVPKAPGPWQESEALRALQELRRSTLCNQLGAEGGAPRTARAVSAVMALAGLGMGLASLAVRVVACEWAEALGFAKGLASM